MGTNRKPRQLPWANCLRERPRASALTDFVVSRHWLVALGFCLLGVSWHTVAQSMPAAGGNALRRVDSVTELYAFGGIHIATNRTGVEIGPRSYAVTTDVRSSGLAKIFMDLKTHSETRGAIIEDRLQPRSYRGEVHRDGNDSFSGVDHHADGNITATAEPAATSFGGDGALIGRSIDQLTAFLSVERKIAQGQSCGSDIRVFDGRHLYILHFRDAGYAAADEADRSGTVGPLRVCRMERQAIAGFADAAGHGEGVYQAVLSYVSLAEEEIAVPLRMELWTEFGSVSGRLATLRVNGVERHVSE
jgi:hypothetical protein